MRNKLLQLLRKYDREVVFENEYSDAIGDEQLSYLVQEHIAFPNYRTIDRLFQEKYLSASRHLVSASPSNSIKAELKRMESDGLVIIGSQEGTKYAYTASTNAPDYDEGVRFTTESVVLTTKGKSGWQYLLYQAQENPFNLIAIIISVVSLIVSVVK